MEDLAFRYLRGNRDIGLLVSDGLSHGERLIRSGKWMMERKKWWCEGKGGELRGVKNLFGIAQAVFRVWNSIWFGGWEGSLAPLGRGAWRGEEHCC